MNLGEGWNGGEFGGVGGLEEVGLDGLGVENWEGQFGIGRFAFRMRENIGYDTF